MGNAMCYYVPMFLCGDKSSIKICGCFTAQFFYLVNRGEQETAETTQRYCLTQRNSFSPVLCGKKFETFPLFQEEDFL